MAKFSGKIGFVQTVETSPGVWTNQVIEKSYKGDLLKRYISWQSSDEINPDFSINNQISIVADSYILENTEYMKYVILNNTKWQISSIDIDRPRLVISLGGLYRNE